MKMNHGPRLELRQGQSLVMTQQLQQSIKLLQATSLELRDFVEAELEKNPFLQKEDDDSQSQETAEESPRQEEETSPREADFNNDDNTYESESSSDWEGDDSRDIERDYLNSGSSTSSRSGDYDAEEDTRTIDDNPSQGETLREHLLEQLSIDINDPVKKMIGANIIDLVDESGYLKGDLSALAEQLGVDEAGIEEVLILLQRFDPPGIFARSLKECLELQLRDKNRLDPAMQCLLDHLDLLAGARFDELQKKCGVDKDDLKQMIAEIKELNPKPGSGFSHEISQAVEPDLFVRRLPDGNWHIELNMNNFPKIMVNKRYYKKITAETRNVKDKDYLSEQFGSASWLVRALEQRAQTMMKVGGELVKQQDAFFRLGVRYLKPMTLKDIAAATGYHESTISRVTSGKFLVCPRGTFELKYFFTSALARAQGGGDDVSSASVKSHIQELIDKETKVLSDDDIVDVLKERNINVARRTVAKYREALGIPSSPKRKRLKVQAL
jgi:RNA polymerase sigma-54 factor